MKAELLDEHRDINVCHHDWWDCVYEMFIEDMEQVGIEVDPDDICFSGFWSQGDGASFTGSITNLRLYLKHFHNDDEFPELRKLLERDAYIDVAWTRLSHHYVHEYTLDFSVEVEPQWFLFETHGSGLRELAAAALEKLHGEEAEQLRLAVKENVQGLCKKLYRQLEEEYDYLTSDEAVAETITANDLDTDTDDEE